MRNEPCRECHGGNWANCPSCRGEGTYEPETPYYDWEREVDELTDRFDKGGRQ